MYILKRRGWGVVRPWLATTALEESLIFQASPTANTQYLSTTSTPPVITSTTASSLSTTGTGNQTHGTPQYDVRIVEVGPRDGLQNEPPSRIVRTEDKVQWIQLLMRAGCHRIEVGSFVNANAVPNMANSSQVIQQLYELGYANSGTVRFSALVPTLRYLHEALKYREMISEIAIFASASEAFSQKVSVRSLTCSLTHFHCSYVGWSTARVTSTFQIGT
jgi:hypothetical protein